LENSFMIVLLFWDAVAMRIYRDMFSIYR